MYYINQCLFPEDGNVHAGSGMYADAKFVSVLQTELLLESPFSVTEMSCFKLRDTETNCKERL